LPSRVACRGKEDEIKKLKIDYKEGCLERMENILRKGKLGE